MSHPARPLPAPGLPARLRFTAWWAFSETALGGFSHALKLPLTGLVLGSLAVLWVRMLALGACGAGQTPAAHILRALGTVLLLKALASPHSPATAYVAVAFQGLLGAALYGLLGTGRFVPVLHGAVAVAESAGQKVLLATLLAGPALWQVAPPALAWGYMGLWRRPPWRGATWGCMPWRVRSWGYG